MVMSLPRIAAQIASRVHLQEVLALEENLAGWIAAPTVGQQAHDRQRRHRLARAGFADERQRLALVERERDAVDRRASLRRLARRRSRDRGRRGAARVGASSRYVFRGSKASRTASPMKTSSDSMSGDHEEAGEAEPRRLKVRLALQQQLAERGRAGRQAEAEEVERGQRRDRGIHDERQEGQRRHHGVRQHVLDDDLARCERPSARAALTYSKLRRAQEFRAHHVAPAPPRRTAAG